MFSWSQGSSTNAKRGTYPGQRLQRNGTPHVATAVQGSIRAPAITRAQHLQSYLQHPVLGRSTKRLDENTYDTVFQTTTRETLMLRVYLPPSTSTSQCPAMSLAGATVQHPWCNERTMQITGYAPIANDAAWSASGLTLGQAVHNVIQHLQINSPVVLDVTDPGLKKCRASTKSSSNANGRNGSASPHPQTNGSSQAPPNYSAWIQSQQAPTNGHTQQPTTKPLSKAETKPLPPIDLPHIPPTYNEVAEMSEEQLETTLSSELEFLAFVGKLSKHKEVQSLRASVMKQNFKMANEAVSNENELLELSNACEDLQTKLKQKLDLFDELESEQSQLAAPPDVRSTMKKLSSSADEAFEESENYADEWVENGDIDVNEFCKQFLKTRTLHHKRTAIMERLSHQ